MPWVRPGRSCIDEAMVKRSREYIRTGLQRQDPAGFNPEKGGWDTSYHAVGLLFAMDYYTLVANDEARVSRCEPMIERGLRWLQARVRPDGTVDQMRQHAHGLRPGARTARQPQAHELRVGLPGGVLLGDDHR